MPIQNSDELWLLLTYSSNFNKINQQRAGIVEQDIFWEIVHLFLLTYEPAVNSWVFCLGIRFHLVPSNTEEKNLRM